MRVHEAKATTIKSNELLLCIGVYTKESNYSSQEQICFLFADSQNRIWQHYQIVRSTSFNYKIKQWFSRMGFNMIDNEPFSLYVDYNVSGKKGKDSILSRAVGRVYWGRIVKRAMKWETKDPSGISKTVKKVFFDVDEICNTWDFNQDKMVELFKKKSTVPNGENIYDWWTGRGFKLPDLEGENTEPYFPVVYTWKLLEEELLGAL